jgi:DNA polymerase
MIYAPSGKKFLNGDLKGIEARGACWVAREWDILKLLGEGEDSYKITAAKMYNVSIAEVDKIQRSAGKISVLAGGFGGGWKALINMAVKMGIYMSPQQAVKYIKDFRRGRKRLVATWYAFGDAAVAAMENPGKYCSPEYENGTVIDRRFKFLRQGKYLFLILPNGRKLSFPFPKIVEEEFQGYMRKNIHAMWVDNYTKKWTYRNITGASFFQSAVQAICRDIIMEAHLRVEAELDMPLILSVHDEGMSEVDDDDRFTTKAYGKLMCVQPDWCKDFPLAADCWEGYRFKK